MPRSPIPNPLSADPRARSARKSLEKDSGGFDWEEVISLALLGATVLFSIERNLDKAEKRGDAAKDGQKDGSSSSRRRSHDQGRPRDYDDRRRHSSDHGSSHRGSRSSGGSKSRKNSTW